jgi:hypothetical protein
MRFRGSGSVTEWAWVVVNFDCRCGKCEEDNALQRFFKMLLNPLPKPNVDPLGGSANPRPKPGQSGIPGLPTPMPVFPMDSLPMKARAKSVKPSDLVQGTTYFMVSYLDDHMSVPTVEPIVFLGRSIHGDSDGKLYFQDAPSHIHGGPYPENMTDEQDLLSFPDHGLGSILTLEEAVEELQRCLARKRR